MGKKVYSRWWKQQKQNFGGRKRWNTSEWLGLRVQRVESELALGVKAREVSWESPWRAWNGILWNFELSARGNGEPLITFEEGSDIIWSAFRKEAWGSVWQVGANGGKSIKVEAPKRLQQEEVGIWVSVLATLSRWLLRIREGDTLTNGDFPCKGKCFLQKGLLGLPGPSCLLFLRK